MSETQAPCYCPLGPSTGYCTHGSCALWSEEHGACTLALTGPAVARIADALERMAPSATVIPLSPALRRVGREVGVRCEREAATGGDAE